jgi:7-carboxy-7-deazaguanine synthase
VLRLLEHYVSTQGECDRTGIPTQFVRFAGCNLKCPGWPCDTEFAINPKLFMKEQKLVPVRSVPLGKEPNDGLVGAIVKQANETGARNICLTGGEPMLQSNDELVDLVRSIRGNWNYSIEMFSNGTIQYPPAIVINCAIRMDWKLPGSGETDMGARELNYYNIAGSLAASMHTIKFTIKDQPDFEEAMAIYDKYDMVDWPGTIYAGPVWNQAFTAKDVVAGILANKLPWRLNVQTHNYVWPAHERAR